MLAIAALVLAACDGGSQYLDPATCRHAPAPLAVTPQTPAAVADRLPLQTSGGSIVDSHGKPVKLASVNWYGAESPDLVPSGLDVRPVDAIAEHIKQLGFNSVRLPWSNYMLECDPVVSDDSVTKDGRGNPAYRGMHAMAVFDHVVRALAHQGLLIILDNHGSDPGFNDPGGPDGLWFNDRYPESQWLADWKDMAGRFARVPAVVGADLRNEPSKDSSGTEATWGDGTSHDWRLAAERAGDQVLNVNRNLLIMVEGTGSGGDLHNASQQQVTLSPACPPPNQPSCTQVTDKLVYAPHDYMNFQTSHNREYPDLQNTLNMRWGDLSRGKEPHPVWVGEFGTCNTGPACVMPQPYSSSSGCLAKDPGEHIVEGVWFANLIHYLAEPGNDFSWSYWPLNGTRPSGGVLHPELARGATECYGVLDQDWSGVANLDLCRALQSIQTPVHRPASPLSPSRHESCAIGPYVPVPNPGAGTGAGAPTPAPKAPPTVIPCLNRAFDEYVLLSQPRSCADYAYEGTQGGGVNLSDIRWSNWGGDEAQGTAIEQGFHLPFSHIPARISAVRPVQACGERVYSELKAMSRYGSVTVRLHTCGGTP
jgi:endoglucanase